MQTALNPQTVSDDSQVFSIVFPILAIVAAGFLYGRKHLPNMEAGNKITIDVLIPALIFNVLSSTSFDLRDYQSLSLAVCIMVFGSALIAWPVAALASTCPICSIRC